VHQTEVDLKPGASIKLTGYRKFRDHGFGGPRVNEDWTAVPAKMVTARVGVKRKSQLLTASPDFGYSQYNDREKDLANLKFVTTMEFSDFPMIEAQEIDDKGEATPVGRISAEPTDGVYAPHRKTNKNRVNFPPGYLMRQVTVGHGWEGTGLGQILYDKMIAEVKRLGGERLYSARASESMSPASKKAWDRLAKRYNVKFLDSEDRYYIDLTGGKQAKLLTANALPDGLLDWRKPTEGLSLSLVDLSKGDRASADKLKELVASRFDIKQEDIPEDKPVAVRWLSPDAYDHEQGANLPRQKVESIAAAMKQGTKFAPAVYYKGNTYFNGEWQDGNNRVSAGRSLGLDRVPAVDLRGFLPHFDEEKAYADRVAREEEKKRRDRESTAQFAREFDEMFPEFDDTFPPDDGDQKPVKAKLLRKADNDKNPPGKPEMVYEQGSNGWALFPDQRGDSTGPSIDELIPEALKSAGVKWRSKEAHMSVLAEAVIAAFDSNTQISWGIEGTGKVLARFQVHDSKVVTEFISTAENEWRVGFNVDQPVKSEAFNSAIRILSGVFQGVKEFLEVRQPDRLVFASKEDSLGELYDTYLARQGTELQRMGYRMSSVKMSPYAEFVIEKTTPSDWKA
jgi:hypothetical protein